MSTKEIDLPPPEFSNKVNELDLNFDWRKWRSTPEWKIFIAGANFCNKEFVAAGQRILNDRKMNISD